VLLKYIHMKNKDFLVKCVSTTDLQNVNATFPELQRCSGEARIHGEPLWVGLVDGRFKYHLNTVVNKEWNSAFKNIVKWTQVDNYLEYVYKPKLLSEDNFLVRCEDEEDYQDFVKLMRKHDCRVAKTWENEIISYPKWFGYYNGSPFSKVHPTVGYGTGESTTLWSSMCEYESSVMHAKRDTDLGFTDLDGNSNIEIINNNNNNSKSNKNEKTIVHPKTTSSEGRISSLKRDRSTIKCESITIKGRHKRQRDSIIKRRKLSGRPAELTDHQWAGNY